MVGLADDMTSGEEITKQFGFEYERDGHKWLINVFARDEQDARERLFDASFGRCLGVLKATVQATDDDFMSEFLPE